jgi:hypothetical protein
LKLTIKWKVLGPVGYQEGLYFIELVVIIEYEHLNVYKRSSNIEMNLRTLLQSEKWLEIDNNATNLRQSLVFHESFWQNCTK